MLRFKFEWQKFWAAGSWRILLLLSIALSLLFFWFEKSQVAEVLPNLLAENTTLQQQYKMQESVLRDDSPEAYQALLEQDPEIFQRMQHVLNEIEVSLKAGAGEKFLHQELTYYQQLPLFTEKLTGLKGQYTNSEKERIYYLQTLKKQHQTYEDPDASLNLPQYFYQLLLFLSQPVIFCLSLCVFCFYFSQERAEQTDRFMWGQTAQRWRYFWVSQVRTFLSSCLCFASLFLLAGILAALFGGPLLSAGASSLTSIVSTSFAYQTKVTLQVALLQFLLLGLPLLLLGMAWFYLLSYLLPNTTVLYLVFASSFLALAFGLRDVALVGNPWRFLAFKQTLFHELSVLDFGLTWLVALVCWGGCFWSLKPASQFGTRRGRL